MAKVTKQKDATCIDCGKTIQINVLASLKTARCEDCKGGNKVEVSRGTQEGGDDVRTAYGEAMTGPRIDGRPNKALAKLGCPYHPHKVMDVIGVIKNDHWGDIVSLQCREKGCYALVQISEQSRMSGPFRTTVDGTSFEPDDLVETVRTGNLEEWAEARDVEVRYTKGI